MGSAGRCDEAEDLSVDTADPDHAPRGGCRERRTGRKAGASIGHQGSVLPWQDVCTPTSPPHASRRPRAPDGFRQRGDRPRAHARRGGALCDTGGERRCLQQLRRCLLRRPERPVAGRGGGHRVARSHRAARRGEACRPVRRRTRAVDGVRDGDRRRRGVRAGAVAVELPVDPVHLLGCISGAFRVWPCSGTRCSRRASPIPARWSAPAADDCWCAPPRSARRPRRRRWS